MRLVDLAQQKIAAVLGPGDIAVDATVGNGVDTLFLARCVGTEGLVYGFDIQSRAIQNTRFRLEQHQLAEHCRLIQQDHAILDQCIAHEHKQRIQAMMFNLGYLPGGARHLVTNHRSTVAAISKGCSLLAPDGRIAVLCYTAHPGGQFETDQVKKLIKNLPHEFRIHIEQVEKKRKSPPELVIIDRCPI